MQLSLLMRSEAPSAQQPMHQEGNAWILHGMGSVAMAQASATLEIISEVAILRSLYSPQFQHVILFVRTMLLLFSHGCDRQRTIYIEELAKFPWGRF